MDTWVASVFCLLWIILQGTWRYEYAFGTLLSILWGRYTQKWDWNQRHRTVSHSRCIILPSHQQCTRGTISAHSHQNLLLLFVFFSKSQCLFLFWCLILSVALSTSCFWLLSDWAAGALRDNSCRLLAICSRCFPLTSFILLAKSLASSAASSEKDMATHSSILAWRIPGTGEPGGLPSMGSHRVGHDWCDLAAAAASSLIFLVWCFFRVKHQCGRRHGVTRRWVLTFFV